MGIIESHARAVDLMTHNYYELLYAFHIYRHNYRKGKAQGGSGCSSPCPWDQQGRAAEPIAPLLSPQLER